MTSRRVMGIAIAVSIGISVGTVGLAAGAVLVQVGTIDAAPGQRVAVPVALHTDGDPVTIFQNDLIFEPQTEPGVGDDGRHPACRQDADLLPGLLGARFGFTGQICDPGVDCTLLRAQVAASGQSFPTDAQVYTCDVQVAADAPAGSYAIRCSNLVSSDASGNRIDGACADGAIIVSGAPVPTPTDGGGPTPVPTPTAEPSETLLLEVGSASGDPGDRVTIDVRLRTGGQTVSGAQVDIGFAPVARVVPGPSGSPDCTFGSDPNVAGFSSIGFQPPGCADDCSGIRGIILTADLSPFPDNALLMSCTLEIAADASPGTYALPASNLIAASPQGQRLELAGTDGSITVRGPVAEAPHPVSGGTTGGMGASGGCAVTGSANGMSAVWLLAGIAAAIGVRRWRRRA